MKRCAVVEPIWARVAKIMPGMCTHMLDAAPINGLDVLMVGECCTNSSPRSEPT